MAKTKEFKLKELRALSLEDSKEKLATLQAQLAKERATLASGVRPENPGKIGSIRKTIARLLTIITEKSKKNGGHENK